MYIAIYVAVILLVGAGMVASFVLYQKKQKQRADCLKKQRSQNAEEISVRVDKPAKKTKKSEKSEQIEEIVAQPQQVEEKQPVEPKIEPVFEDYDFDGPKPSKKPATRTVVDKLNQSLEEDDEDVFVSNSDFAKKFAAYEKFLEEEEDEEEIEEVNPFRNDELTELEAQAVAGFDYDALQGKTENEIKDMTKHLPRAAQEIILTEVMHRRTDDED